jgi:putative Mg2+ transporter-C (MgtC) family protein
VDREYYDIVEHLLVALAAGGLIGFERSYHGRPAGFRTHTLVCVASSALMLITMYQSHWYPEVFAGRVALDPTRMAQGIMTGIGFLGAGVIFKEGLTVRGLTTAASIWITAAIGILAGIGFYFPLILAVLITLGTLALFRWIENKVPGDLYAHLMLRFAAAGAMGEDELRRFLAEHGFSVANLSYGGGAAAKCIEYQMVIRARSGKAAQRLAESLARLAGVEEYRITPTGD